LASLRGFLIEIALATTKEEAETIQEGEAVRKTLIRTKTKMPVKEPAGNGLEQD
jgi:predicted ATP-grasp superfamily ATP-dependent carboligase